MPRYSPGRCPGVPRALRSRLVLTGLAAALCCTAAVAQEADGLRGAVEGQGDSQTLIGRRGLADGTTGATAASGGSAARDTGIPTPPYRPISPGAVPDDDIPQTAVELDGRDDPTAGDRDFVSGADLQPASRAERDRRILGRPAEGDDAGRRRQTARDGGDAEATDGEEPVVTGTIRAQTIDSEDEARNGMIESQNQRAEALESLDREEEEDPYAAVGIRAGSFILKPSLEQGLEWSSNVNSSAGGGSGVLSETTLRLDAESDWARNSANISAYGTFRKSISGVDYSAPEVGVDADFAFDLGNLWRVLASAGYNLQRESASDPNGLTGTTTEPLEHELTGSLGIEKYIGKALLRVTGAVDRQAYGDAELAGGATLSQSDRNETLTSVTLRGGYEISPALTPFVELEAGRRVYDETVDANGYRRSSKRLGVRGGAMIDFQDKLTGEFSAGWLREDIDDARLASVSGATVDASLTWQPSRFTSVTLGAATTVETSTAPGSSGSILYDGTLEVSRALRSNLTGTASFGAAWRDFTDIGGHDLTLSAELGITYWLNRSLGLVGRVGHERLTSSDPTREYEASTAYLGMRWQR